MTKFEKLLEAVPDALVGMDQKGVIRFVNHQTEALFGYDRDQLIGLPVEKLVPEPLWQIYAQNREDYFADPRTRSSGLEVELVGVHRDGTQFPINISMAHIDTGDVLLVITAVADVTRHQTAVRNAQLLAAIVDASDDAIIGTTLEGVITSWNPAAERMYGYAAKEMIGRSGSILATPGQGKELYAVLARTQAGEVVEHLEVNHLRKDGSVVPISLTVAPISDENGTVVGSSSVARDVTEHRRAFEAAERLAAIVGGSEDAIFGSMLDGTITSWNRAAEALFGYSAHEIIGKSGRRLSPKGRAGETRAILARIGAGQRVENLEAVRVRKDGTAFPVSLTVSPIRDQGGAVVGASAILRDVTAQRKASETSQQMAALVEYSQDAIVSMSPDGIITSWNPAAERTYGYSSEEVVGKPGRQILPEDRAGELSAILASVRDGQVLREDSELPRKDGTPVPVSITLSPIRDVNGEVAGVVSIHRDMTEQKRALVATQRLAAIVESADDAILSGSLDGIITSWNPAAERLYGYSGEEIVGRSIDLLIPEDRRDETNQILAEIGAGQHVAELETVRVRKDGTAIPVSVTVSPICDRAGTVVATSAVHHDMTAHMLKLEAAQRLAAIVESSTDAIVGRNLDGTITSWNPAAEAMYGYSGQEIIGRSSSLLVPAGRTDETDAILAAIEAGQPVEHREIMRVRKDGSVFSVSLTVSPIRDAGGTVVGASLIHRDMTAHMLAFQAAQRMAAIVNSSEDAIIGETLDGVITSWNPAAEAMYGYSSEEIVGQSVSLLVPEDQAEQSRAVTAKVSAGQHVQHLRTFNVRKDGTVFPISLTVSPLHDPDGAVTGASVTCRDVTEQEHAAHYARSLIEADLDPLMTIDPEGRINDVNEASVKVTGVPREKLIGTDFSTYFTDPGKAVEGYEQVFARGTIANFPLTVRHRDGTLTDLSCHASLYRDLSGAVRGILATGHDVTEQKKAFEAAQRMAAVVESSDDAIMSGSLDGIITSWNPAAEKMYGYSSAEVVGKSAKTLTPADRRGEIRAILAKIKAGQAVEHLETKRIRKDGSTFPVSLTVSPVHNADGAVVGTSVIHRDLTEQKGALADAQRIASIVEYSDDAIIGKTLDGTITSWNRAAGRMFGYSSKEMVGKPIGLLIPEDRTGEVISILAKISAGKPVTNYETTRLRKDGTPITVSLTTSPHLTGEGAVVGASEIYRDVTELKHAAQYARSLIETALDPLVTISPTGKITDVNEATVKITGVPRHKLIGTDFSRYFTDPGKAHEGYERVFEQESVTDYPLTLRHRDGTLTDVLYNASVYRDSGGKVLGVFAAAREVTRQK